MTEDTTIVTERLKLVQDDPSVVSVIAFHPVYRHGERPLTVGARRESLRGFAAVVFRIRPVVMNALRGTDLDALDVVLVDADAAPSARTALRVSPRSSRRSSRRSRRFRAPRDPRRPALGDPSCRPSRLGQRRRKPGVSRSVSGLLSSALAAAFAYAASALLRLRRQVGAAKQLGQYTLVEKLGEGGMGTVYRAHHALLRRPTAIKLLHPTARARAAALRSPVSSARFS